jgi:hypothetical protein
VLWWFVTSLILLQRWVIRLEYLLKLSKYRRLITIVLDEGMIDHCSQLCSWKKRMLSIIWKEFWNWRWLGITTNDMMKKKFNYVWNKIGSHLGGTFG